MTTKEARKIAESFDKNHNPSEDDVFMFTEAMNFLIEEEHDPGDMMYLGGYYYEIKRFDLALKYYEMAATYDYDPAYESLAYGNPQSEYKVADMYRNGYYVEKDQKKYEQIIEDLYPKGKDMNNVFDPVPEVFTRLAMIRTSQGREEEAVNLYLYAKDFLAQRIRHNAFFGNLNIMKWLIDDLYELIEFDEEYFDFFDLYYLLRTPHKVSFIYEDNEQSLESVMEGNECTVCFNGKWFHSRDDFFKDGCIGNTKLTAIYDKLYGFEVKK